PPRDLRPGADVGYRHIVIAIPREGLERAVENLISALIAREMRPTGRNRHVSSGYPRSVPPVNKIFLPLPAPTSRQLPTRLGGGCDLSASPRPSGTASHACSSRLRRSSRPLPRAAGWAAADRATPV